jgi:ATPase subunit of ABC transporter with duplicated ATPase domains
MDLPSVERLERALADYPGALVLITHDYAFARRCTSILWTVEGGAVTVATEPSALETGAAGYS